MIQTSRCNSLELLGCAVDYLGANSSISPRTDSELLLMYLLGLSRAELYLENRTLTSDERAEFSSLLDRKGQGEPLQYIIGHTEFMGLKFEVNPAVFIPRPETEILVEKAIELANQSTTSSSPQSTVGILDLGTGCGNIAISLTKYMPGSRIVATDISEEVLQTARENARLHSVQGRIDFRGGELFDALAPEGSFDLIVSNPPYISRKAFKDLPPEVKKEPLVALDGGEDGLDFYRRIIPGCLPHLKKGGYLAMEFGFGQREAIEGIFRDARQFGSPRIVKDYNSLDRVIVSKRED